MQKIILLAVIVVLVLSISIFSFMGCQGQTSLTQIFSEENIWREAQFPETFTYNMYKGEDTTTIGTLTMEVVKLNTSTTYYMGQDGLSSQEAQHYYAATTASGNATYMATTTLTLNDASYSQKSIAIFANNYKMLMTYSKIVEGEKVSAFVAYNEDGKRYYYRTNANWDDEKAIKNGKYVSSPYFDNTMVYYVARSIPNDTTYSTFAFNIFNHETNAKEKVSLYNSCDTSATIIIGENQYSCRKIGMTTSDVLLGRTNNIACYVTYENIGKSKQVITRITEGDYRYDLVV